MRFVSSGPSAKTSGDWVVAAKVSAVLESDGNADLLNESERAHAARFLRPEDGQRYRAAHHLKRCFLGEITGQRPKNLLFGRQAAGKPYLSGRQNPDFNISHGGDWVIVGSSWSGLMGVDVEADRPAPFWKEIAASFLTPCERGTARDDDFLKLWTAKEAGLKAHGAGLSIMPYAITVTEQGEDFVMKIAELELRGSWHQLDETHTLAVATGGERPELAVCRSTDDLMAVLDHIRRASAALPAAL